VRSQRARPLQAAHVSAKYSRAVSPEPAEGRQRGSQGLTYLAKALESQFFPELLKVRTSL